MKKYYLILSLIAVGVSGCASVPPPAKVSAVSVTTASGKDVHILDAYIAETDGRLAVCGKARQAFKLASVVPTHIDAQFLDASGRELALKSIPVYLRGKFSAHGYPASAFFQIPSEPWPQATTRIVVSAHEGTEHS